MKLSLLENAIDSMENAIECFIWICNHDPYYEDERNTKYLKQGILSICSSTELLIKIVLSDINELLIYPKITDIIIKCIKEKGEMKLYDYIVKGNYDVHTIEFSECVDILFKVTDILEKYKRMLTKLRVIRNQFMHFGIDFNDEYYELLYCISNTIYMINEEPLFFNKLKLYYGPIEDAADKYYDIDSLIFSLNKIVDEIWVDKYKPKIKKIINILEEQIDANDVNLEIGDLSDDIKEIGFIVCSIFRKDTLDLYLDLINSPEDNSLILGGKFNYGPIFAIFPLSMEDSVKQEVYISRDEKGVIIEKYDALSEFWVKSKEFYRTTIDKSNIDKILKNLEQYILDIECDEED